MKKINFRLWLNNNLLTVFLAFLLMIFIILTIILTIRLNNYESIKNIRGTYMSHADNNSEGTVDDRRFYVFNKEKYYFYKYGEMLRSGSYKEYHNKIYVIKNDDNSEIIYYDNEKIYSYNSIEDKVIEFKKIDNIPTFITVDPNNQDIFFSIIKISFISKIV